jgi:deoxycytidine triphosphate deaminase
MNVIVNLVIKDMKEYAKNSVLRNMVIARYLLVLMIQKNVVVLLDIPKLQQLPKHVMVLMTKHSSIVQLILITYTSGVLTLLMVNYV